jgi:hypothetical protein
MALLASSSCPNPCVLQNASYKTPTIISGVFFLFHLITDQLFESYVLHEWCVHNRLFNAYYEVKFKKTPDISRAQMKSQAGKALETLRVMLF